MAITTLYSDTNNNPWEEGTTPTYTTTLLDEAGAAVTLSAITGARLTFADLNTGATINGRSNQDIKNANNVTIHATSGLLTWKLLEADMLLVASPKPLTATHRALFVIEWDDALSVARQIVHEVHIPIVAKTGAPFSAP